MFGEKCWGRSRLQNVLVSATPEPRAFRFLAHLHEFLRSVERSARCLFVLN
jgi:hypothetical protein